MSEATANLVRDIHELEPTAILEFFAIYYDPVGNPDAVFRFHSGKNSFGVSQSIVWRGSPYIPMPMEGEGWEVVNASQKLPRPKIKFSNFQFAISQLIQSYNRLLNAKIVRQRVYLKHLDAQNFKDYINPHGIPNANAGMPEETYYVSRVVNENRSFVEFELVSALELENINIPSRQIIARYCNFNYRCSGCNYIGAPKETSNGNQFTNYLGDPIDDSVLDDRDAWTSSGESYAIGDYVWKRSRTILSQNEEDPNLVEYAKIYYVCRQAHTSTETTDPFKRGDLWVKDECSKRLNGCRARFSQTLPFGGFLSTAGFSA